MCVNVLSVVQALFRLCSNHICFSNQIFKADCLHCYLHLSICMGCYGNDVGFSNYVLHAGDTAFQCRSMSLRATTASGLRHTCRNMIGIAFQTFSKCGLDPIFKSRILCFCCLYFLKSIWIQSVYTKKEI